MCRQPASSAAVTAAPTSPGADSQVPRPMSGILAPERSVSERGSASAAAAGVSASAAGISANARSPAS
eukprot:7382374-Prymnesium_polylepis.1